MIDPALLIALAGRNARITFLYKNYKGETAKRTCRPVKVYQGATDYHKQEQWLLEAFDEEKQDVRHFAIADILDVPKEI